MECEELAVCGIIEMGREWVEDGGLGIGKIFIGSECEVILDLLGDLVGG